MKSTSYLVLNFLVGLTVQENFNYLGVAFLSSNVERRDPTLSKTQSYMQCGYNNKIIIGIFSAS